MAMKPVVSRRQKASTGPPSRRPEKEESPRLPLQPDTTPATGWWRLAVIATIVLVLALVMQELIWVIARPLGLLFGAVVIAQAMAPIVGWLERRLPRTLAVVLVYVGLLALVAGVTWLVVPELVSQAEQLFADQPGIELRLRRFVNQWSPIGAEQVIDAAQGYLSSFSGAVASLPLTIFASLTELLLIFFLSLYWLIAQPKLRGYVLSLVPGEQRAKTGDVLTEIGQTIGGYVRGTIIDALIVAALTYVGLLVIGLRFPLVLAIIAGIGELIPVVGPILSAVPALGIALVTGDGNFMLALGFYVALQQIESNVLVPLVMRSQAHIPPLLSLFAFFVGTAVAGIVGALIAIPLFGALQVIVVRMLVPAERRWAGISPTEAAGVRQDES